MTDYLTTDEAQRWVGQASNADLADLEDTVAAVSRAIDAHCQRNFGQVTESRDFAVDDDPYVLHFGPFGDLVSVTSVATDDGTGTFATTVSASGYELGPRRRTGPETRPYSSIRRLDTYWPHATAADERQARVRISGVWGWPAVSDAVKAACRIQVSRVFKRADSPLGVAGFGEFGVVRVSRLDPDVESLLAPYRVLAGIA